MSLARWTRLSTELLFDNPWWQYRRDVFEHAPGERGEYHYVASRGSVMIVPVLPDGRLLLVEQYRYLGDRRSLELPAGGMAPDEAPERAALRELGEETGHAGELVPLGAFNPWNGVTDEICHVFRATRLVPLLSPPPRDTTESFVLHALTASELDERIASGALWDGMTMAAYALHRLR